MPSADYVPILECPRGCKAAGGKPIASTIRGWKSHMSRQHKGWEDNELAAVLASVPSSSADPAPSSPGSGKEAFLKENEGSTKSAIQIDRPPHSTPEQEQAKAVKIKTEEIGKKFNSKLNKMKKRIGEALPKAVSKAVAEKGPAWQLTTDDSELLGESVENALDVLDIDFQITPFSTVLTNPLWALLLPALALLLVFIPKSIEAQKLKGEEEDATPIASDSEKPAQT